MARFIKVTEDVWLNPELISSVEVNSMKHYNSETDKWDKPSCTVRNTKGYQDIVGLTAQQLVDILNDQPEPYHYHKEDC